MCRGLLTLGDRVTVDVYRVTVLVSADLIIIGVEHNPNHHCRIDRTGVAVFVGVGETRERDLHDLPLVGRDSTVRVTLGGVEVDRVRLDHQWVVELVNFCRVLVTDSEFELRLGVGPPDRHLQGVGGRHV